MEQTLVYTVMIPAAPLNPRSLLPSRKYRKYRKDTLLDRAFIPKVATDYLYFLTK